MGSFSWLRADKTTKRNNLTDGDKYKFLIPQEFEEYFIVDTYHDYAEAFHHMTIQKKLLIYIASLLTENKKVII